MTEHLPECPLLEPCSADTPQHGFCSRQSIFCIHCERQCICEQLRACEERVQKIAYAQGLGAGSDEHRQHEIGWIKGYTAGLDAAWEAVEVADRNSLEALDPLDPVTINAALAAIDGLKEKQ